jgi:hypothetical protein
MIDRLFVHGTKFDPQGYFYCNLVVDYLFYSFNKYKISGYIELPIFKYSPYRAYWYI